MNGVECQSWIELSDRRALGEALTPEELVFAHAHVARCELCRTEESVWSSLDDAFGRPDGLTDPIAAQSTRSGVRSFVLRLRSERAHRAAERSRTGAGVRPRLGRIALAAAALAAGLALFARTGSVGDPEASAKIELVMVAGQVELGAGPASAGRSLSATDRLRVRDGRACLAFEPRVAACFAGPASASVAQADPQARSLRLESGYVVARLGKQPAGTSFRVETPAGSVTARGTLFVVEILQSGETLVRLHEGSVLLTSANGATRTISAPAQARLGASIQTAALGTSAAALDGTMIGLVGLASGGDAQRLDVTTIPPAARVSLDGVDLGPSPVSVPVAQGQRIAVEHPGYAPVHERLALEPATNIVRNYELVRLAVLPAEVAEPPSVPAGDSKPSEARAGAPSPSELLVQARALRQQGRYAEAGAAYGRLRRLHPASAEARAALVSLGELQLSELGDPRGALQSFDAYLARGGALAQEARYGRIRALGRLGRSAEERSASERFLADYPGSAQAASLRSKLARP